MRERLRSEDMPLLEVETDYSSEDNAQLATRIHAFLEVLRQA